MFVEHKQSGFSLREKTGEELSFEFAYEPFISGIRMQKDLSSLREPLFSNFGPLFVL